MFVKLSSGDCHRTLLMITQHCFRWWLGAVRHQAITWAIVDPDLSEVMRLTIVVLNFFNKPFKYNFYTLKCCWLLKFIPKKTRISTQHTVNIVAADDLMTQGTRASAVMVLTSGIPTVQGSCLTHRDRNKRTAILQTFSNAFSWWLLYFDSNVTEFCFWGSSWQLMYIGFNLQ